MDHGTLELTFYPVALGATEYPVTALYRPDEARELSVRRAGGVFRHDDALKADLVDAALRNRDYGEALGRAVFQGAVRELLGLALADTPVGEPLHVLIALEAEPLRTLRWERLLGPFAPGDGEWDFLALNPKTALAVYVAGATQQKFPPVGLDAIRVLLVVASPGGPDAPEFGVADAVAAVTVHLGDRVTVLARDVPGAAGLPTLDQISIHLKDGRFTVLHVVAHGTFPSGANDFCLVLEKSDGTPHRVPGQTLITALRRLPSGRAPYLTFLAACESAVPGLAAQDRFADRLARDLGLPAVVGMADPVSADTAAEVASAFYRSLLMDGRPDVALVAARVGLTRADDVLVPVLVSQLGGRQLFDPDIDTPPADEAAVARGLTSLAAELELRAPVLLPDFEKYRAAPPVPGAAGWEKALDELNNWADEVVGVSFNGLCSGTAAPPYKAADCPFNGMKACTFERRAYFKAREKLVAELATRLVAEGVLAVVGPSGSGKSSAVFAGLLPHLGLTATGFVSFAPGSDPHRALAEALTDQPPDAILVVDQFEELFTHQQTDAVRAEFIEKLKGQKALRKVIVTLRSEFREKLTGTWLEPLVSNPERDIAPMPPDDLRRAVEEQAAEVGLRWDEGLKSLVIENVGDEPGRMPLLQHTLRELWKRRRGVWLKTAEYEKLGGVHRAVANTADEFVCGLNEADHRRAVDIFLRLTRVADETDMTNQTRRRVRIVDLVPAGEAEDPTRKLLTRMANEYLVITSGADAEVAHEALLRYWATLGEWVKAHRAVLLTRQSVALEARSWDSSERMADGLMRRGAKLAEVVLLRTDPLLRLNTTEVAYLDTCEAAEEAEEANRARQERFRRRAWVGAACASVALVGLLTGVIVQQVHAADDEADRKFENAMKDADDQADRKIAKAREEDERDRRLKAERVARRSKYADQLKLGLTYRDLHPVRMERALVAISEQVDLLGFEWYHLKHTTAQSRLTIATPTVPWDVTWLPKPGRLLISTASSVWFLPTRSADTVKVDDWRQLDVLKPDVVVAAADAPVVAVVSNLDRVVRFDLSGDTPKALPAYTIPAGFLSSSVAAVSLDCIAISADGKRVAVASFVPNRDVILSPTVHIAVLDAAGAAYSKTAVMGHDKVTGMAFTPAGELAVVNREADLFILAVEGVELKLRKRIALAKPQLPIAFASSFKLSPFAVLDPTGVQVAVLDEWEGGWVKLFTIAAPESGQTLNRPKAAKDTVLDIQFAADGEHLVVLTGAELKQPMKVGATWYLRSGKQEQVKTFTDNDLGDDWEWRPRQRSGRWAAVSHNAEGIRMVWKGEAGSLRVVLPDPIHQAEKVLAVGNVPSMVGEITFGQSNLRPGPAGEHFSLITYHPGYTAVRLIDPVALQQSDLATRKGWKQLAAWFHYPSDDERYVASLLGTPNNSWFPLAVSKLDGLVLTPVPLGGLSGVEMTQCLGFRPKQHQLFVTRLDSQSTLERWDVTPAGLVPGPKFKCDPGETLERRFVLTPNRVILATQKAIYEWDADTGRRIHRESITGLRELRPVRGQYVASVNEGTSDLFPGETSLQLVIWDTNDWSKVCRRILPGGLPASGYAIHPSGRRLVSSELGTRITFWDIGPWGEDVPIQEVVSLEVPKKVTQLTFSADGHTLAGVSDGGVHLWRAPGTPAK